jgi:hypothetical protein
MCKDEWPAARSGDHSLFLFSVCMQMTVMSFLRIPEDYESIAQLKKLITGDLALKEAAFILFRQ